MDARSSQALAAAITKAASLQTYYTIRFFVDRPLRSDAYRAYAYFRWVDDVLDAAPHPLLSGDQAPGDFGQAAKLAFLERQSDLLEACCRAESWPGLTPEEQMLADLVQNDRRANPGLRSYLHNMMAVMAFDARRRGRVISKDELAEYSRLLATAVTDALHYFIGHADPPPDSPARYLAVTGAHIVHMLRDALEDAQLGYYNIPQDYLSAHRLAAGEVHSPACCEWARTRAALAKGYFQAGRQTIAQVKNRRCRLAGYAYVARFEWTLRALERNQYRLCAAAPASQRLTAGFWMFWRTLTAFSNSLWTNDRPRSLAAGPARFDKS